MQDEQLQRLQTLVEMFRDESDRYQNIDIPADVEGQKRILRSLMNIRMPRPLSANIQKVQDEYLQARAVERGIVHLEEIPETKQHLSIWQGDITRLQVDAIVNAANAQMLGCFAPMHTCIDNCIHTYAGVQLRLKMHEIMQAQGHEEPTGQAKITPGYNLPCKYVLHTVGPIVDGPLTQEHERLLSSCYLSCLNLAKAYQLKSIAFCCISTGVFMFPNQRAAEIAVDTVKHWQMETGNEMRVIFNVFKNQDLQIYQNLLSADEGKENL